ncbi:MAG TPA: hypothetical protein VFS96_08460 [Nitrolancea sp.]|nr:hypothetical protein [Nitrolancea sp.]
MPSSGSPTGIEAIHERAGHIVDVLAGHYDEWMVGLRYLRSESEAVAITTPHPVVRSLLRNPVTWQS